MKTPSSDPEARDALRRALRLCRRAVFADWRPDVLGAYVAAGEYDLARGRLEWMIERARRQTPTGAHGRQSPTKP